MLHFGQVEYLVDLVEVSGHLHILVDQIQFFIRVFSHIVRQFVQLDVELFHGFLGHEVAMLLARLDSFGLIKLG